MGKVPEGRMRSPTAAGRPVSLINSEISEREPRALQIKSKKQHGEFPYCLRFALVSAVYFSVIIFLRSAMVAFISLSSSMSFATLSQELMMVE